MWLAVGKFIFEELCMLFAKIYHSKININPKKRFHFHETYIGAKM